MEFEFESTIFELELSFVVVNSNFLLFIDYNNKDNNSI